DCGYDWPEYGAHSAQDGHDDHRVADFVAEHRLWVYEHDPFRIHCADQCRKNGTDNECNQFLAIGVDAEHLGGELVFPQGFEFAAEAAVFQISPSDEKHQPGQHKHNRVECCASVCRGQADPECATCN